jgi:4-hydroxybutyrate CoA-transferase
MGKLATAEEAVGAIRPGEVVMWSCLAEPVGLTGEFERQKDRLRGISMVYDLALYPHPWFKDDFGDYFRVYDNYPGAATREAAREGRIEFIPWPFGLTTSDRASDPARKNPYAAPDVFLVEVTEPDEDGYVSFGNYPWYAEEAPKNARLTIAEMNPDLMRTSAKLHLSKIDFVVKAPQRAKPDAAALPPPSPDELPIAQVIGAFAADLVRDGDTVQIGVGGGSEWAQDFLDNKRDLGVHSEFISVKIVHLVEQGVINNSKKNMNRGKCVMSALGIRPEFPGVEDAMRFVQSNPDVFEFRSLGYVANARVIAAHDNITAINSALSVDLTGQIVLNYLNGRPISGIGGNLDFTIGAHYSTGGRSAHCLMSTAQGGKASRIVPQHPAGAVIGIPRTYVDYLITEHGVVNLEGRSERERAQAIISLAHPDFRNELTAAARTLDLL